MLGAADTVNGLPPLRTDQLFTVTDDGRMYLDLHAGQERAWDSQKRFVAVIAGTQGGKTSFGPHWLFREMSLRGPGDYMVVTPTYKLLKLKALPEFLALFEKATGLGWYQKGEAIFHIEAGSAGALALFGPDADHSVATRVIFGYALNPESLESATAKGAWLDEAGQNTFKVGSWEAIQRRLALHAGRALITTTPYNWGWLKTELYDRWVKSGHDHPYIDIIRFKSTMNPLFSQEEYERAKNMLPDWKFRMFYDAEFTRPAGMIYGDFEDDHIVTPFPIPDEWPRYLGVDFGGVNTAAVYIALDPINVVAYVYREYHAGNIPIKEHAAAMLKGERTFPTAKGGAPSEDNWRTEFGQAGLFIGRPDQPDVELGIADVIALHKSGRYKVFGTALEYLDEKRTYGRKLDAEGNPTEDIADKNTYHLMDAERYISGVIRRIIVDALSGDRASDTDMADMFRRRRKGL